LALSPALLAWAIGFGVLASAPTGPVALLIIKNTLGTGPRAGFVTAASLVAGELAYLVLFVLGLGGTILGTPWLEDSLFLAGAAALAFVGVQAWRETAPASHDAARPAVSLVALFRTGFVLTVTNPAILMIFAGFLASARAAFGVETVRRQMFPALAAMELGTALWFSAVVVGLSRLPERLAGQARLVANRVAGVALVGFGAWLFLDTLHRMVA